MEKLTSIVAQTYGHFMHDSLRRNSILLILDTALLGVLGFIFWIIGTRLYSQYQVGLATTLIASSTLLASLSIFGFDNSFTRFLPGEKNPQSLYNTGISLVGITSLLLASAYLLIIPHISQDIHSILHGPALSLLFIGAVLFASLNTVTNGVFLAFRSAKYILFANLSLSISKIIFPLFLVSVTGMGLYISHVLGMAFAAGLSVWFIFKNYGYSPTPGIDQRQFHKVKKFSLSIYAANILQNAPPLTIPIIITSKLGPASSAIFYLAMMASNIIFVIPNSASSSLLAEGSNDEKMLWKHAQKAGLLILMILVPLVLLILIFGGVIISIFGKNYGSSGGDVFRILAFSSFFIGINGVASSIMKVKHRTKPIVTTNLVGALFILISTTLVSRHGLNAIAFAWLTGQAIISLLFCASLFQLKRKN